MPSSPPQKKRSPPVPLLLSSFPVPPSHIPPTPSQFTPSYPYSSTAGITTNDPPPSAPPSTPLPPVPGPSRISEHEQILLLSGVAQNGSSGDTTPRSATSLTHSQSLTSSTSSTRRQSRNSTLSLSAAATGHVPSSSSTYYQQHHQPIQSHSTLTSATRMANDAHGTNISPRGGNNGCNGNGGSAYSINAPNNIHTTIITTAHNPNNFTTSNTQGHTAPGSFFSTTTTTFTTPSILTTATTMSSPTDNTTSYPRTPPTQIISLATQSPSPFTSPNTSRMLAASPLPGTQLTRISVSPMPLSDIDDFESGSEGGEESHSLSYSFSNSLYPNRAESPTSLSTPNRRTTSTSGLSHSLRRKRTPPPKRVPSPVIPLSARKQMRHAHNESISEIDIRDLMDLDDLGYGSEEGDAVGDLSADLSGDFFRDDDLGFVVKGGGASWNGKGGGGGVNKRDSMMDLEDAYDYQGKDWTPMNSLNRNSLSENHGGKRFSFGGASLNGSSLTRRVSSGGLGPPSTFAFGAESSGSGTMSANGVSGPAQSPTSKSIRLSSGFSPRSSISNSTRHHKYTSIADPIDPDAVMNGYSTHAVRESVDLLAGFGRSGRGRVGKGVGGGDVDEFAGRGSVDEFGRSTIGRSTNTTGRTGREEGADMNPFDEVSNLREFTPRSRGLNGFMGKSGDEPTSPSNSTPSRRSSMTRHRPSHTIDRISQMFSPDVRHEGERESGELWRASLSKEGLGSETEAERRDRIRESASTMTQLSGVTMGESMSYTTTLSASASTVQRPDVPGTPSLGLLGLEESPELSGSSFTASSSPSFYTANNGEESREDLPLPLESEHPSPDPVQLSPKSLHLSLRAERTRSKGLKQVLQVRQRSRSRGRLANGDHLEGPRNGPPEVPLPELPSGIRAANLKLKLDAEKKEEDEEKDDILDGLEEMGRRVSVLGSGSLREKRVGERERDRDEGGGDGGGMEMTMDELGLGPPPGRSETVAFPVSSTTTPMKTPMAQRLRPRVQHRKEKSDERSSSPDIEDILSTTPRPRPRAKSNGRYANSLLSRSSTSNSSASNSMSNDMERTTRLRSFASVSALSDRSSLDGVFGASKSFGAGGKRMVSESSGPGMGMGRESWVDQGFGLPGDEAKTRQRTMSNEVSEGNGHGRDEVEDVGADSDSSLDLHTPLPHLMLRHGLLSPHSKLLPQSASRANTPAAELGRPASTMSFMSAAASVVTKSGIIKDERDTPMRRVRHRDGKLLRGGIGLTTGLGWSDSEDEDAPSPLTRRLSQLNLQRRASSSSLGSSSSYLSHSAQGHAYATAPVGRKQPHPLTRSYSYGTLNDTSEFGAVSGKDRSLSLSEFGETHYEDEELVGDSTFQSTGEWAQRQRKPSAPPTSWHGKGAPPSASRPTSGSGSLGPSSRRSSANSATGYGYRTSSSSLGSALEASAEADEYGRLIGGGMAKRTNSGRSTTTNNGANRESVGSAASASHSYSGSGSGSSGSNGPITPLDSTSLTTGLSSLGRRMNKEKSLPPLPSSLKKPRVSSASSVMSTGTSGGLPRPRTVSSTNSAAGTGLRKPSGPINTNNTTTSTTTTTNTTKAIPSPSVRPLQLPRQAGRLGGGLDRAPVPVPSISTATTSIPRSPSSTYSPLSSSVSSIRTPTSATNPHSNLSIASSRSFGRLSSSTYNSGSVPSSPMAPPSPNPMSPTGKPQPRTGTGMAYKTSTSKMRAPMVLTSSASVGNLKSVSRG